MSRDLDGHEDRMVGEPTEKLGIGSKLYYRIAMAGDGPHFQGHTIKEETRANWIVKHSTQPRTFQVSKADLHCYGDWMCGDFYTESQIPELEWRINNRDRITRRIGYGATNFMLRIFDRMMDIHESLIPAIESEDWGKLELDDTPSQKAADKRRSKK